MSKYIALICPEIYYNQQTDIDPLSMTTEQSGSQSHSDSVQEQEDMERVRGQTTENGELKSQAGLDEHENQDFDDVQQQASKDEQDDSQQLKSQRPLNQQADSSHMLARRQRVGQQDDYQALQNYKQDKQSSLQSKKQKHSDVRNFQQDFLTPPVNLVKKSFSQEQLDLLCPLQKSKKSNKFYSLIKIGLLFKKIPKFENLFWEQIKRGGMIKGMIEEIEKNIKNQQRRINYKKCALEIFYGLIFQKGCLPHGITFFHKCLQMQGYIIEFNQYMLRILINAKDLSKFKHILSQQSRKHIQKMKKKQKKSIEQRQNLQNLETQQQILEKKKIAELKKKIVDNKKRAKNRRLDKIAELSRQNKIIENNEKLDDRNELDDLNLDEKPQQIKRAIDIKKKKTIKKATNNNKNQIIDKIKDLQSLNGREGQNQPEKLNQPEKQKLEMSIQKYRKDKKLKQQQLTKWLLSLPETQQWNNNIQRIILYKKFKGNLFSKLGNPSSKQQLFKGNESPDPALKRFNFTAQEKRQRFIFLQNRFYPIIQIFFLIENDQFTSNETQFIWKEMTDRSQKSETILSKNEQDQLKLKIQKTQKQLQIEINKIQHKIKPKGGQAHLKKPKKSRGRRKNISSKTKSIKKKGGSIKSKQKLSLLKKQNNERGHQKKQQERGSSPQQHRITSELEVNHSTICINQENTLNFSNQTITNESLQQQSSVVLDEIQDQNYNAQKTVKPSHDQKDLFYYLLSQDVDGRQYQLDDWQRNKPKFQMNAFQKSGNSFQQKALEWIKFQL